MEDDKEREDEKKRKRSAAVTRIVAASGGQLNWHADIAVFEWAYLMAEGNGLARGLYLSKSSCGCFSEVDLRDIVAASGQSLFRLDLSCQSNLCGKIED